MSTIDILGQIAKATAASNTGTNQITALLSDAANLTTDNSDFLKTAANDASLVSTTESAANLSTIAAKQKLGLKFGTDVSAQNEIYSLLTAKEADAAARKDSAKSAINAKTQVSPLDDPVSWLLGKLTVNQDITAYNNASTDQKDALDRINALNAATAGSAVLQTQFAQTTTQASAEAAARIASTAWQVKANEMTIEGLKLGVEGIKTSLSKTVQQLQWSVELNSAQNADRHLALAWHNSQRADDEFDFRKEEKLKNDQYETSIGDDLNLGRAIRGLPELTGVKLTNILMTIKTKGPMSDEYTRDWQAGSRARATGVLSLGATPVAAMTVLNTQAVDLPDTQIVIADTFKQVLKGAETKLNGLDPKDVRGATKILDDRIAAAIRIQASDVSFNDPKNIFTPVPISEIVKASPAAAATPVYQKILKPIMDAGGDMNDPNKIAAALVSGIRTGKISYDESLSAATIWQAAADANMAQKDLPKFGLVPITSFNTRLENVSKLKLFNTTVVDVTNPVALGTWINKQLAQSAAFGPRPPGVQP